MWSHPKWFGTFIANSTNKQKALHAYQHHFNSVEGNTSFYQVPSVHSVENWLEQVDQHFSFTFKFPREISHSANLSDTPDLTIEFCDEWPCSSSN